MSATEDIELKPVNGFSDAEVVTEMRDYVAEALAKRNVDFEDLAVTAQRKTLRLVMRTKGPRIALLLYTALSKFTSKGAVVVTKMQEDVTVTTLCVGVA